MTATHQKSVRTAISTLVGLILLCAGIWSAALSDPGRYSLDVREDRWIFLYATSGFVCTIAGTLLLLMTARHTTRSMPLRNRRNANAGVAIGFVLQLAGLFLLPGAGYVRVLIGCVLILVSLPVFLWGTMNYAQGKGHSKWMGIAGVAGIVGVLFLILLPPSTKKKLRPVNGSPATR